ncbi:hypothetical protein DNTS_016400 [Danionella cerebrum]|uniref:Uncharacterized protein n=1 Tax=Danionella cerebrum TaxID=2873325 RepID=A0A553Q610_9TELE|nr:hypothetical protein DNTS_016400 [Danionella translucida]
MRRMSASQRHQWKAHQYVTPLRNPETSLSVSSAPSFTGSVYARGNVFEESFSTQQCYEEKQKRFLKTTDRRRQAEERETEDSMEERRLAEERGSTRKNRRKRGRKRKSASLRDDPIDAVDEWDTIAVQTKPEKVQRIKETYSHPSPHCTTTVGPFCGEVKEKMAGEDGKATKSS